MLKTLSLSFIGLLFFSTSLLVAADDDAAISVRFTCLAWDTIKANGVQYLNGEQVETLRVGQTRFSAPYRYTGPNPIVFFREKPGLEAGEVVRVPVASAYIQPGLRDVLILFSDAERSGESANDQVLPQFKALALNNDLKAFPAGTYRIINLSQHQVGGIMGEEKFIIPGKQTKMISKPVGDGEDMRVHFSMKIDDQWEPKINTAWMFSANKRYLVFLTDIMNARRPYLKLKTITENLEGREQVPN
jgi:hypothetical protein